MRHIQPKAPDPDPDAPAAETIPERARIGIVCATVAMTALVYSTHMASFLHIKFFVLACGLALLGIATVFARRSAATRTGWLVCFMPFIYSASNFMNEFTVKGIVPAKGHDETFALLLAFLLPMFTALAFGALSRERDRRWVSIAIIAAAACASLLGIGQYAGLLSFLFPSYPGASPIYSVFGNSGLLGGYIAIALALAFAMYLQAERIQPFTLATLPLLAGALLLTGARTAWLAAALGCAVSIWKYPNVRRTAIAAAALAAVATLCIMFAPAPTISRAAMSFTPSDAGANLRWWFWAGTWEMVKAHPIAGVGLGRYSMESPLYLANVLWSPGSEHFAHNTLLTEHPHNDFLLVWAETGVLGFALCVWIFYRLLRCSGPEWGGLVALFVFALFNSPLHSPPHALAGFLLGACMVKRTSREEFPESILGTWGGRIIGLLVLVMPVPLWFALVVPSYRLQQAEAAHIEGRPALALYSDAAVSPGIVSAEIDEKYAIALLDVGDYESARDRFTSALGRSDSGSVYLGLGTAEYLLGNRTMALRALEKAVYRWPSHVDAWRLLLRVCPEKSRDEWLKKAGRFLSAKEMKALREDSAVMKPEQPKTLP